MKTKQQIKKRIDDLYNFLSDCPLLIADENEIVKEREITKFKIEELEWVLGENRV